ncbi:3-methyladenine DNA glycosylase [Mycobacterium sp. CVI_P3]|uniref:3-methyladenine DNA glycosylase n=1 Tax=Mycobacterium pinniadriaticum TaxID=2994102 RepID=A0ABT3S9A5_9MYCO|nr:3-methyladenine DNA glycosylase [Mycobacterium pinniadriaticum]MCX2929666.1 3-methyladenine DNA glycosylase [Mycobacterium pinniadriaticum]MCX2936090.1 3-methyladenine DNA glycosylase [Mycobacterium pinniadriaticum]
MPHVLGEAEWTALAATHRSRVETFTGPHQRRSGRGEAHPVWDFLFSYYSLRPRQLRVWHPGFGAVLAGTGAHEYLDRAGYVRAGHGVTVGLPYLKARLETVRFVADLLRSTQGRAPQFGCFGMHEWAMVYRTDAVRHGRVPLRLGSAGTDAVVESMSLRCTHFDAYRFFTDDAAPRNCGTPSRADQRDWEQPGCLHANMDLYKWCYKLSPLVGSDLLVDCLQLAAEARELDMRASPYDLSGLGFEPITVEEPAGRAEYVRRQTGISERAAPLRRALLTWCDRLLRRSVACTAYDSLSEGSLPAGKMN